MTHGWPTLAGLRLNLYLQLVPTSTDNGSQQKTHERALKRMDANCSAWTRTAPHGRTYRVMDTHTSAWTRIKQSWKELQRRDADTTKNLVSTAHLCVGLLSECNEQWTRTLAHGHELQRMGTQCRARRRMDT